MKMLAMAAAVAAVAGLAAGCNQGADPETTQTASTFAECLQQQGIQIQVPSGRPGGGRPSGEPGARPSGFPGGGMRPSGQPFPRASGQPGNFPGGGGFQRPDGVDEETWNKALEKCGSLRPSRAVNNELSAYLNCLSEKGITYSPGMTPPESAKVCEVLRPSGRPSQ